MQKIITVTLNPSLDETIITNHLNIGYRNHVADNKRLDASGRGVNVSSALSRMDTPSNALVMLGNDSISSAYKGLLNDENFDKKVIYRSGSTRSDTIIVDTGNKTETHIIDDVVVDQKEDLDKITEALQQTVQANDIVVFAGNLPKDAPLNIYGSLIDVTHELGAKAVLLAKHEPLKQALRSAPNIVVLTPLEAEFLFNYPVRTDTDMIFSAKKLLERGCEQVFVVMSDYSSVILVDGDDVWLAEIADREIAGTSSGVIDAMLAGYLSGIVNGKQAEESLLLGASAMAYAMEQVGNEFGTLEQLEAIKSRIHIGQNGLQGAAT